ncbi:MAG: acyl-CoA dehydrogenase N-terminal domain-containing protein, partial [Sphingomonadaceae bacterium]|nr:acyl-CoA dehydrogenase N-terminal domain-containing protein [Sphingomonadaceae bacterium]
MTYTAPLAEQRFVLDTVADLHGLLALPPFEAATPDLIDAVLAEAGKLAQDVFAPLNA